MKIGIVGTGNISSRHFNEFNNMPNVNVEAVCDTNQKNLEIFLSNNKDSDIRGYLSLEEMLEKEKTFDGISNTTPDKFHKETTLQILKSGYNVFCEKPPGRNMSEITKVIRQYEKNKKLKLMYGFNHRYHYSIDFVKKLIDSKKFADTLPRFVNSVLGCTE